MQRYGQATVPLLLGVFCSRLPIAAVWSGSVVALMIHFGLFFRGSTLFPDAPLRFGNPGVTAAIATLVALPGTARAARLLQPNKWGKRGQLT